MGILPSHVFSFTSLARKVDGHYHQEHHGVSSENSAFWSPELHLPVEPTAAFDVPIHPGQLQITSCSFSKTKHPGLAPNNIASQTRGVDLRILAMTAAPRVQKNITNMSIERVVSNQKRSFGKVFYVCY